MRKPIVRLAINLFLALAILEGWWFLALPFAVLGAWLFPFYIEIIIAGIAYDALFGYMPDGGVRGYAGTVVSVLLALIITVLKRVVRR